jgi:copper chaperone CopZ
MTGTNKKGRNVMIRVTAKVDGMMCGMCESHVNDAVRSAFQVQKVTSSHAKGRTEIITEQDIDEEKLKEVIGRTGYEVVSVTKEPYEKKGFLSRFK